MQAAGAHVRPLERSLAAGIDDARLASVAERHHALRSSAVSTQNTLGAKELPALLPPRFSWRAPARAGAKKQQASERGAHASVNDADINGRHPPKTQQLRRASHAAKRAPQARVSVAAGGRTSQSRRKQMLQLAH